MNGSRQPRLALVLGRILALFLILTAPFAGETAAGPAPPDVTGAWRLEFPDDSSQTITDTCRLVLEQHDDDQFEGKLDGCDLGTDGLVAGAVDATTGSLSVSVVAPDDPGCRTYTMTGTVMPDETMAGTFQCTAPLAISGPFRASRCDPGTAGSCPDDSVPTEVRACTPRRSASPCKRPRDASAKLRVRRLDGFFYDVVLRIPKAADTTLGDFGLPTEKRDYAICVYQPLAPEPELLATEPAFAAKLCDSRPCWTAAAKGFKYRNRKQRGGMLESIVLKAAPSGKASVKVRGAVTTVAPQSQPDPLQLPLSVQVLAADSCWEATFATAKVNDGRLLKAKGGE